MSLAVEVKDGGVPALALISVQDMVRSTGTARGINLNSQFEIQKLTFVRTRLYSTAWHTVVQLWTVHCITK